eukprot:s503_g13.t1
MRQGNDGQSGPANNPADEIPDNEETALAATKIQAKFRQKQAASEVEAMKKEKEETAQAATKIQAKFRQKQAKNEVEAMRASASAADPPAAEAAEAAGAAEAVEAADDEIKAEDMKTTSEFGAVEAMLAQKQKEQQDLVGDKSPKVEGMVPAAVEKRPMSVSPAVAPSKWDVSTAPLPEIIKSPKKRSIREFRSFLEQRYGGAGGAGRAWRVAMDVKGRGALSPSDFGSACRAVGWKHDHLAMFKLLKAAGNGLVRFRALDPETAEALVKFKDEAEGKCRGPVSDFWAQFMDPGDAGAMSRTEFLNNLPKILGMPRETLVRVFNVLDPTDTGWVAGVELEYLETFESGLADFVAEREQQAPLLSGATNKEPMLPTGVLAPFNVPWQVTNRKVLSAQDLRISPLGRQLWAPHRSSRSFQYRALENTHLLKHRWLSDTVQDRCLYKNYEPVRNILKGDPCCTAGFGSSPVGASFARRPQQLISAAKYTSMTGAMAAAMALLCLPSVLAVSDLHLHKYKAASVAHSSLAFQSMGKTQKGRTLGDDETGKPTVVNGEHLDPYNVPEQLIGDVGLAGPKGEPGKKGVCGEPGPMGKNVSVAKPAAEDGGGRPSQVFQKGSSDIPGAVFGHQDVPRLSCGRIRIFRGYQECKGPGVLHICGDPLHACRTLHPQCALLVDLALPAEEEDITAQDDSYISMSFGIANVNFPSLEAAGHVAAVEEIVKSTLAKAAVAGGASGIVADNAAVAMGEGDENSSLVSATMSPPDGVSVTQLQQALAKGQLQALLPSALDAAPGVESFKKGPISVTDFESQIEKPSGGEAGAEEETGGAAESMRSEHSKVFKKKRKDFIFRTSHEFYRKGVERLIHGEVIFWVATVTIAVAETEGDPQQGNDELGLGSPEQGQCTNACTSLASWICSWLSCGLCAHPQLKERSKC